MGKYVLICKFCGKEFESTVPDQLACSKRHGMMVNRAKRIFRDLGKL